MRESHTIECMRSGVTNCTCNQPKVVHEWDDKPAGEQSRGEHYRITEMFAAPHPYHNYERLEDGVWHLVSYGASPLTRTIAALAAEVERLEVMQKGYEAFLDTPLGRLLEIEKQRDKLAVRVAAMESDDQYFYTEYKKMAERVGELEDDEPFQRNMMLFEENTRLRERVAELENMLGAESPAALYAMQENPKLRAALEGISVQPVGLGEDNLKNIARAALKGEA